MKAIKRIGFVQTTDDNAVQLNYAVLNFIDNNPRHFSNLHLAKFI